MGEIQRQAVRGTIFNYLGTILGFLYVGILFPKSLSTEEIGLLSVLVAYALIAAQLSSLGFNAITTRLFTYFRNPAKKHNGFMMIGLSVHTIGFIICSIILLILQYFHLLNREGNQLFDHYFTFVFIILFAILFFNFFDHYFKVLYNALIGTVLKEFVQRLVIFAAIILVYFNLIEFPEFAYFYVFAFTVPLVIIIVYLIKQNLFSLRFPEQQIETSLKKEMCSVAFYSIISGFAGILTLNIDRIMIQTFIGLGLTGVYTTMFFFGALVSIPSRALMKISSTYIADAWKDNDINLIDKIFRKSVLNQAVIGIVILVALWVNIDNILAILKPSFLPGKYVILVIGGAYLIDMLTGVSNNVLGTSKYFRYTTYFIIIQTVFIIITNVLLISKFGILGAALGSLISKLLFNLLKMGFIYKKFNLLPYSYHIIMALALGGAVYLAGYYLPFYPNPYIDAIIKGGFVTIFYFILIYFFNISEDINLKINQVVSVVFKKN